VADLNDFAERLFETEHYLGCSESEYYDWVHKLAAEYLRLRDAAKKEKIG
jgi:hypothetical protein